MLLYGTETADKAEIKVTFDGDVAPEYIITIDKKNKEVKVTGGSEPAAVSEPEEEEEE
jgi:hypothetical protein